MKQFLLTLLWFCLLSVLLVLSVAFVFGSMLNNNLSASDSQHVQTLILGDSRTEAGLNPAIIPNSLNVSASGEPLFFSYVKLKKLIAEGYRPSTLLLSFNPGTLNAQYFQDHPRIKNKLRDYLFLLDLKDLIRVASINPFATAWGINSFVVHSPARKLLRKQRPWDAAGIGGFRALPLQSSRRDTATNVTEVTLRVAPHQEIVLTSFQKIKAICAKYDIELLLIATPVTPLRYEAEKEIRVAFDNYIAEETGGKVVYLDYQRSVTDTTLFFDGTHLNARGAAIFSETIAKRLRLLKFGADGNELLQYE